MCIAREHYKKILLAESTYGNASTQYYNAVVAAEAAAFCISTGEFASVTAIDFKDGSCLKRDSFLRTWYVAREQNK
jgi:hypothetical protein